MNTKDLGNIAEAYLTSDLLNRGFTVLKPEGDNCPFDRVIYKDGIFKRIQIKYCNVEEKGSLSVRVKSQTENTKKRYVRTYSRSSVDFIGVYSPRHGIAYIPIELCENKSSLLLRTRPTRNNQSKRTRWLNDFRALKF